MTTIAWADVGRGGLLEPKLLRKVLMLLVLLLLLLLMLLLLFFALYMPPSCRCWLVGWLLFLLLLLLLLMCEIVFVDLAQRARGTGAGAIPGTCTAHGCRRGAQPFGVLVLNPRQARTRFAFGIMFWQQRGGCSRAGTCWNGLALALPR